MAAVFFAILVSAAAKNIFFGYICANPTSPFQISRPIYFLILTSVSMSKEQSKSNALNRLAKIRQAIRKDRSKYAIAWTSYFVFLINYFLRSYCDAESWHPPERMEDVIIVMGIIGLAIIGGKEVFVVLEYFKRGKSSQDVKTPSVVLSVDGAALATKVVSANSTGSEKEG